MRAEGQDGRSLRAEAMRQARREEILKAAEGVFSRQGYHSSSVSDLIEAAGISRGTFYLYFDGKEAIFLDLIERFIQRITNVVRVVDPGCPDPTREIFENILRVVNVVFDDRELAVMVLREDLGLKPAVDEKLGRLYGFMHEMVEGALVNGAQAGLIREVDSRVVATALVGAIKEVFYHELITREPDATDRREVARGLLDFGMRGLMLPAVGGAGPRG